MMKRILAALGLMAAATTAQAQDTFTYDWVGPYGGGYLGGSFFETEASDLTDTFTNDAPPISELIATYGINGGYNWQPYDDNLLLGLELDVQGGNETSQLIRFNSAGTDGQLYENKITSLTSLRGRAGVVNGKTLIYFTGGVAFGEVDFLMIDLDEAIDSRNCSVDGIICAQAQDSLVGLNVGMGLEYAFRDDMTARFEIMHYDLESTSAEVLNGGDTPVCSTANADECSAFFDSSVTQFRFGVNFKF
ncbi:outer membrane immunogenic protein [Yoonia litorea]|uniref:Outer membrane immunogenic protein n=2 Tax=Yoonia litorea TaxID=1123755 RepID=A0A1I6N3T6_9RHOB|nr:outer membrane immunogenic protein [Yoonia litorea]